MEQKSNMLSPIQFRIVNINTIQSEYNQPKAFEYIEGQGHVNFNVDPKVGFKVDSDLAFVTLNITASIIPTKEIFFKTSIVFTFAIVDLKNIIVEKENKILHFKHKTQEDALILPLISISFSTARGIIMERYSGTVLQAELLPIVDPKVFIKPKTKETKN